MTKRCDIVSSEDYVMWSDGIRRSPRWHPHDHAVREAIRLMFAARLDEQILAEKWDLEHKRAKGAGA
jgi:hypothetical protein